MTPQSDGPELPRDSAWRDVESRARVLESEAVFEGAIWDVRRDRFRFGDGELVREYVQHPGSVAVLALDDDDRVVMVLQYRHTTGTRFWELPAGLRDVDGEEPLVTAQRELAEEVELAARHWQTLVDYFPSPGGSSEHITIYRATGLSPASGSFEREGEEAELEVHRVPFADALAACLDGSMRDGLTVTGILAEHTRRTLAGDVNGHGA